MTICQKGNYFYFCTNQNKLIMRKLLTIIASLSAALALNAETIEFQWIDKTPSYIIGQSWGVPFAKGEMNEYGTFTLTDATGKVIPTQAWPMARHNDGSIKWMGFYATISPEQSQGLTMQAVKADKKAIRLAQKAAKAGIVKESIVKTDNADEIVIDNGVYEISFPKTGSSLVGSIVMDGKNVATDGKLIVRLEDRSRKDVVSYSNFESKISSAIVERSGEVAAVVKVEGMHKDISGTREWLPFCVRFYIYKGAAPVKIVHSFVFDGEQREDYIKGIGLEFSLPFREQIHNRHVSFAGEGESLWQESVEPLLGYVFTEDRQNAAALQVAGKRVPDYEKMPERTRRDLDNWAKYNDYRLVQANSDGFTIQKRTGDHSAWFGTAAGHRSRGMVLAGDVSGGIALSLKNFWQSFPAELSASEMLSEEGKLTVWMWSPSVEAMDMRHYDIVGHDLGSSYEDWVEGYDTAYGIARTSEITLFPYSEMPSREEISDMADIGQDIVQIMATPQYLHDAGAFGVWSLPDPDGNDTQKYLERQIDLYLDFYEQSMEAHRWYGFWNYGDVMHSYSTARHTWNYDHGGRAWHNTELETDLWLWFGFIRSGRADFYRMATAMTRHTSEVDSYHIGRMKGLGTRHNVTHWGCGAKEARVGQAWWKRYYYYMTTDDRLGDLMRESLDADYALLEFDPLVRAQPRSQFPTEQPTRLRWGPDWTSLVGNWFTEWERTGEQKWLDKINAGMNSLCDLPNGLFTGKGPYGYNPETGVLTYEGAPEWVDNRNHLANLQSSVEIMLEVLDGVDNKKFTETYLDYASWYGVPKDDPIRELPENARYKNWHGNWNIQRLTAIAANRRDNEHLKDIAWDRFLYGIVDKDGKTIDRLSMNKVGGTDSIVEAVEDGRVSSNDTAQWNLEAIIMMELLKDSIPELKDIRPYTPPVWPRN